MDVKSKRHGVALKAEYHALAHELAREMNCSASEVVAQALEKLKANRTKRKETRPCTEQSELPSC